MKVVKLFLSLIGILQHFGKLTYLPFYPFYPRVRRVDQYQFHVCAFDMEKILHTDRNQWGCCLCFLFFFFILNLFTL